MGNSKNVLRRIFKRSNRNSVTPSTSLAPPGSGSSNRPTSSTGSLESTLSSPSSPNLTSSQNAHERSDSPTGHVPSSSTTVVVATSSDLQRHASPSPQKTPWEKAVEKLNPDDRKEFDFDGPDKRDTLTEVLQAANDKRQECEDKRWTYKKGNGEVVILRDLADRILTNLNKFVKIGDIAVQYGPQTVSAAWTAFKFLLQVALNDMEIMANLMSDLEYISRILGRCAVYEKLYDGSELISARNFINWLPDLYAAILTYLCRSKSYFGRNTAMRYVSGIINSYSTEFSPLMDEMKKLEHGVESAARAAADEFQATAAMRSEKMSSDQRKAIADLQDILQSMQQGSGNKLQKISQRLEDTERYEILRWLSEVTYQRHHDFISSVRQANTGHWLFEKHDFVEWKKSTSSSIFWLHGIAGAGKTVLASLVIDTFKQTISTDKALAYFYCKYGEHDRQDPESILRTIVQQLSNMSPEQSLPEPVVSLYQQHKREGFKSGSLRSSESKELISELSKAFEQTVIVVDALDECDKDTRRQFVNDLKSLRSSAKGLKLFVTSRNDDDILIELENEPEVYIQSNDNASDIERFVVAKVERCISEKTLLRGSVKPELKQVIVDTLIKGADGMFLWVDLQIKHISRERSEKAIRTALQRLPKDLEATYSDIWDRICADTEDNCTLAKRTLKWIICAQSPLTPDELLDAVSITPMQWEEEPDHSGVTQMTLLDVCQNFLVIDEKLGVFRSAHFSVTEFLQRKFQMTEAHTAAAEVSLTLLCCENLTDSENQDGKIILRNYALSDYAMKNCVEHIRLAGDGSDTLMDLQKEFFKPSTAYYAWLLVASDRDVNLQREIGAERPLTPLWVTCYHRLWDIFEYILSSNADYNTCNVTRKTALHLMAAYGYDMGVKYLLEKEGVELNPKDFNGNTPLHYAAKEGHLGVAKLLLEQETVDRNCQNRTRNTPLHLAAENGYAPVVKLFLEQKDVGLNCENRTYNTPLHLAAVNGYDAVVKLFLGQEGVDLNPMNITGSTPLQEAVWKGHDAVAKLLIAKEGVDLNCENNNYDTPLLRAAYFGNEMVVRMLLERGDVNSNCRNNNRDTPLHLAAFFGYEAVVKLLLAQKSIELNSKNSLGNSPLHLAASRGYDVVAKLLLEQRGVDLNCKTNNDDTPLHRAAYFGNEAMVRLLLDQEDVILNSENSEGKTPRDVAESEGHETVLKLLEEVAAAKEKNASEKIL